MTTLQKLNKFANMVGHSEEFIINDEDEHNTFFILKNTEYGVTLDKTDGTLYAEKYKYLPGSYYDPPDTEILPLGASNFPEDVCFLIFNDLIKETKEYLEMVEQLDEGR